MINQQEGKGKSVEDNQKAILHDEKDNDQNHNDNQEKTASDSKEEEQEQTNESNNNERAMVMYERSNEEVLPLAIQNDNLLQTIEGGVESMNKANVMQNIEKITMEGDLSPKQTSKLKET